MLRIHHDTINESGLSPYQILFGRERNEAGIPYQPPRESETAAHFFARMKGVDEKVAEHYQQEHKRQMDAINAKRSEGKTFEEGEKVWILRAQPTGGNKMESWWLGPAKVMARVGKASYKVLLKPGMVYGVHRDWMKPYVEDEIMGTGVPLFHHQGTSKSTGLGDTQDPVQEIKKHRVRNGKLEFYTRWKGATSHEDSWEPGSTFVTGFSQSWLNYLSNHGLEDFLLQLID